MALECIMVSLSDGRHILHIFTTSSIDDWKGLPQKEYAAKKVPDYTITWKNGYSTEPFGRLWWDEIVPTVVTRPQPHNRVILHPEQDRILSLRENARLQGFPDYYRFYGPIKERYTQVGNAVAVPVARALGHSLSVAYQGAASKDPLLKLPQNFSLFK